MDANKFYVVACQHTKLLGDILHLTAAKTKEAELGDYFYRLNKK
jgi:hypothetical protein